MTSRTGFIAGRSLLTAALIALLGASSALSQERRDEGNARDPAAAKQDRNQDRDARNDEGRKEEARKDEAPRDSSGRAALGVFVGPSPTTGARIHRIEENGAAAQAGLRSGDYILSINDTKVARPEDVQQAIAALEAGQEAEITFWRNGETQTVSVMLGERRTAGFRGDAAGAAAGERGFDRGQAWMGFAFGEAQGQDGLVIRQVMPNSPAAQSGLRAGDVIRGVGTKSVGGQGEFFEAMRDRKAGDDVWLSITRDGEEHAVKVTMADRSGFSNDGERRDFRGGFRHGFDHGQMARFQEEHQSLMERIDKLEAEVRSLKDRLGDKPRNDNRNE